jgi:hypothetical protein
MSCELTSSNSNNDNKTKEVIVSGFLVNNETVDTIYAIVAGDNMADQLTFPINYDKSTKSYSGRVKVPDKGNNWIVTIKIFDTSGKLIGQGNKNFNNITSVVNLPTINARNSVPTIFGITDTSVSINDTVIIKSTVLDSFNGEIVSWEWDIGKTGNYSEASSGDTSFIAPSIPQNLEIALRVTDNDGNVATKSATVNILEDSPIINLGNDLVIPIDSIILLNPMVTQQYGTISIYKWDLDGDGIWDDSSSVTGEISHTFSSGGIFTISIMVRDDDNNESIASKKITVGTMIIETLLKTHQIWRKAMSPYIIKNDALILDSASLIIEPGVHIIFQNEAVLALDGAFSAVGTEIDTIKFEDAYIELLWTGPITYDSNGNYIAGPRFEYCKLANGTIDAKGKNRNGFGPYLKNTILYDLKGFDWDINGTYISHCIINNLGSYIVSPANTVIINSYIDNIWFNAAVGPFSLTNCQINNMIIRMWSTGNRIEYNNINYISFHTPENTAIHNNNIVNNASSIVIENTYKRDEADSFDASFNYWGPDVTEEMNAKGNDANISVIKDWYDDFTLVRINYSNWLSVPIPGAGPDW